MPQTTKRFFIPAYGSSRDAILKALALVQGICESAATPRQVTLVTPTKDQLKRTELAQVLGERACKALSAGQPVGFGKAASLRFATPQTFKPHERHDIILAVYGSAQTLERVDEAARAEAVIVVPWTFQEVEFWQQVWDPTVIPNGLPEGMKFVPQQAAWKKLSPIAVEGLKVLTGLVNLSTGIGHELDRNKAVALFRALKKSGEYFDGIGVRSWTVHNGWGSRGAIELAEVAQGIAGGKRVQAPGAPTWGPEFVEKLRRRAQEHPQGGPADAPGPNAQ